MIFGNSSWNVDKKNSVLRGKMKTQNGEKSFDKNVFIFISTKNLYRISQLKNKWYKQIVRYYIKLILFYGSLDSMC